MRKTRKNLRTSRKVKRNGELVVKLKNNNNNNSKKYKGGQNPPILASPATSPRPSPAPSPRPSRLVVWFATQLQSRLRLRQLDATQP